MTTDTITCPNCKHHFPLTEAMAAPIEARLKAQYDRDAQLLAARLEERERSLRRQAEDLERQKESVEDLVSAKLSTERAKLREEADAKAREAMGLELKSAQEEAAEQRRKLEDARRRELELAKRERALEEQRQGMELQIQATLDTERVGIAERVRKETQLEQGSALRAVQEELETKTKALAEARAAEMVVRRERAKLEEEKAALALEVQRQIDSERDHIRLLALKQADEQHRLVLAEKEQVMAELRAQLDVARRKTDQGSQQVQGEVLEAELERLLKDAFPLDLIEPVPKGVFGGDVVQRVRNDLGQVCGTILWESKRTKNWQDGFLAKLRDDSRAAKADACAIMTMAMPKAVATFAQVDGVWVTNRACMLGVAAALRVGLIQVAEAKRAMQGQQGKMELVYHYLTGPQFRQRVEAIVESFSTMQKDLDAEKRAYEKLWAKREKQIERAALNAMGMHGDLAGIVGASLPELEGVKMPELARLVADGEDNK